MKQLKFGLAVAACLGLVVAGTAVNQFSLVGPALADKGGNGNGGNGNGGGHGNGGGSSGKGNSGNHGKSSGPSKSTSVHDKTKVPHDKSKAQKAQKASVDVEDDVVVDDIDDNTLGPLNAAHASARARERAAPNSSVGKIATYELSREAALALTDPVLREQALEDAASQLESDFARTLTDDQIDQVNALLDARQ